MNVIKCEAKYKFGLRLEIISIAKSLFEENRAQRIKRKRCWINRNLPPGKKRTSRLELFNILWFYMNFTWTNLLLSNQHSYLYSMWRILNDVISKLSPSLFYQNFQWYNHLEKKFHKELPMYHPIGIHPIPTMNFDLWTFLFFFVCLHGKLSRDSNNIDTFLLFIHSE